MGPFFEVENAYLELSTGESFVCQCYPGTRQPHLIVGENVGVIFRKRKNEPSIFHIVINSARSSSTNS